MIETETTGEVTPSAGVRLRRRLRGERGAVGTEMAIVVAIVVAISLALGVVMTNSAESHQECIPETVGATIPTGC